MWTWSWGEGTIHVCPTLPRQGDRLPAAGDSSACSGRGVDQFGSGGTGGWRGETKTEKVGASRGVRPVPFTCVPARRVGADSWALPCSRLPVPTRPGRLGPARAFQGLGSVSVAEMPHTTAARSQKAQAQPGRPVAKAHSLLFDRERKLSVQGGGSSFPKPVLPCPRHCWRMGT